MGPLHPPFYPLSRAFLGLLLPLEAEDAKTMGRIRAARELRGEHGANPEQDLELCSDLSDLLGGHRERSLHLLAIFARSRGHFGFVEREHAAMGHDDAA